MQTIGLKKKKKKKKKTDRGYEEDLFSLGQTYIVKVLLTSDE